MLAQDLSDLVWKDMISIQKDNGDNLISVKKVEGVYVFKLNRNLSTINKKETDIIYIGQSIDLRHRIWNEYISGDGLKLNGTAYRLHKLIQTKYLGEIKVGYKKCEKSKEEEKRLLTEFVEEHDQLPSWNRRM
jgi:hypothetical protein